ncbi:unnamed protein product [Rhizophagus irregularis]|nr:unnamed protein product [Rhizophagus irregularis]
MWILLLALLLSAIKIFGKQLQLQPAHSTCTIAHWISDCSSHPGDLITLTPCPGCDFNLNKSLYKKKSLASSSSACSHSVSLLQSLILPTQKTSIMQHTTTIMSTVSWADIMDGVISYFNHLSIHPDFSEVGQPVVLHNNTCDIITPALSAEVTFASSPIVTVPDSQYIFFIDGSLINLGSVDVSMGWSWVQIVPDSGFPNSIAAYAHGLICNWPSSSRAEAAAIYAALTVTPANSAVSIYTDSQTAIDGLK